MPNITASPYAWVNLGTRVQELERQAAIDEETILALQDQATYQAIQIEMLKRAIRVAAVCGLILTFTTIVWSFL